MAEFIVRVYNGDDNPFIGAEITVYNDTGDKIDTIEVTDAETLNQLKQSLNVIDETYFDETRLLDILTNSSEENVINATLLNGYDSSNFAKTSQLSNYALVSHNHNVSQITNLYNYSIALSDYKVSIGDDVSVIVKVTNPSGTGIVGQTVNVLKDNAVWQSSVTDGTGQAVITYTATTAGLITFSVKDKNIQLSVRNSEYAYKGFNSNLVSNGDDKFILKRIGDIVVVNYNLTGGGGGFSDTSWHTISSDNLPAEYRPKFRVWENLRHHNSTLGGILRITSAGVIEMKLNTANSAFDMYGSFVYYVK